MQDESENPPELPKGRKGSAVARGALDVAGGALPFFGGLLSAASSAWSEREQKRINDAIERFLKMLFEDMREKERTLAEVVARLDMHDEEVASRVESPEYQLLLRKAFRDWAGGESEDKRIFIRNLLANAAASKVQSDDVVNMFLQWIKNYSELHFAVVSQIYNNAGITRGEVWRRLGKKEVRENSSDADLYKLLFRDLSTGGIVRQHRETDYMGNFIAKKPARPSGPRGGMKVMKSAFDEEEQYELTKLGQDFVHYVMTDIPPKLNFRMDEDEDAPINAGGTP